MEARPGGGAWRRVTAPAKEPGGDAWPGEGATMPEVCPNGGIAQQSSLVVARHGGKGARPGWRVTASRARPGRADRSHEQHLSGQAGRREGGRSPAAARPRRRSCTRKQPATCTQVRRVEEGPRRETNTNPKFWLCIPCYK